MRVSLGIFARQEIEAKLGSDIVAGVSTALRHYAKRLAGGSEPIGLPPLALISGTRATSADLELHLELEVEQSLAHEVHRQGTSLEQLMTHAVFVYLADLDRPFQLRPAGPAKSAS